MSAAVPQVPPRPTRAQNQASGSSSSLGSDIPKIPPRPANRRLDRSASPSRESFARSPLNETPFLGHNGSLPKSSLGENIRNDSGDDSGADLPLRPSSVALPSIGQEGNEYAEVFEAPKELGTSSTQTRNIANDLKLHAPKPSLPTSSAKQRVSQVTRTDSDKAASFGIGKAGSDDKDPSLRDLKSKTSFASQASNDTERPSSSLESDHGIPEIGQRVPMYPDAGDVQAPSPGQFAAPYAPGIGFHNDGSKPRHHAHKTSAREHDMPLEAYGRHGHQVLPHDRFERAYYEKHPELFKKEHGQYGEGKPEWAMSSDDLNKIVRDTASRGSGLGTSGAIGTPNEQVGFQASEEYTSRMSSPRPQSSGLQLAHSNTSQSHVDSPLRKTSFPADTQGKKEFEGTLSRSLQAPSDTALESELDDDDVIHVDTARRTSRIYGGESLPQSTEELGIPGEPDEEDTGYDEGYSAPILASDEVAKEPFGYELQAAVSPPRERRNSQDYSFYQQKSASQTSLSGSRDTSRPGSIHVPSIQFPSSTKLEDLEEYEPLFPEDEKNAGVQKPLTAADRLKRPELKNRKFPSQDIWEDTPNSLQYTATVSTPQLPEEAEATKAKEPEETPEQAFARRQEELAESESRGAESFLHREMKKPWTNKAHLDSETRPGMKQRFPSRDIWEDSPDSLQLQTTVAGPQSPEKESLATPDERPTTGAVAYHQEKAAAGLPLGREEGRATTGIGALMKPSVPARPTKSKLSQSPDSASDAQPAVPERPSRKSTSADTATPPVPIKTKPQVPARPSKPISRDSGENVPLSQVPSNSSAKSVGSDQGAAAAAKPKPPVPARPVGSKIAALQGGFMADLNKRLQLGAQPPKKEDVVAEEPEAVKEKAPLADARKGRARGPARRAPAKSPAPVSDTTEKSTVLGFSLPQTVWHIDPEADLVHIDAPKEATTAPSPTKDVQSETPTLAANISGQELHDIPGAEHVPASTTNSSVIESALAGPVEEAKKATIPTVISGDGQELEPKSSEEPAAETTLESAEENDLSGSTATLKAETESETVE
ncbi:hypothetical protein LAWI1_G002054 [Lachnellula willkommii]|uniref:Altered inheritance of mitochondria protein 21 n=1 Tax=Lachnellula willkommii TaxID=215461 RepID=A0A559MEV8_9HELO|nr:hypothetical protein LAWI1_G002054 [Lachnellula willkommii]